MKILIISDGKAGHLNQSIAFAKLKGFDFDILEIHNNLKPLTYLLDFMGIYFNIFSLHVENKNYKAVISTGSDTYYANKYIAKSLDIKSVAIMLPRGFKLSGFDYILVSQHDNPKKRKNIITLPLSISVSEPKGYIKKSDIPSIGVILGGSNAVFQMNTKDIEHSLNNIFNKYPTHLKYITTSRRTPSDIEKLLKKYKFDFEVIYSKEPSVNPIPDFLDVCDELFITIDSTSMLCEAKANSDAKIHIIELKSDKKDTKFHNLAKTIENLEGRFDFTPYLEKVKL